LLNFRALYVFGLKKGDLRVQVIAHQVQDGPKQFVTGVKWRDVAIGGMNCSFGPRQGENEPTMADIDGGKPEDAAEECAVGFGILAVKENVRTDDHAAQYTSAIGAGFDLFWKGF